MPDAKVTFTVNEKIRMKNSISDMSVACNEAIDNSESGIVMVNIGVPFPDSIAAVLSSVVENIKTEILVNTGKKELTFEDKSEILIYMQRELGIDKDIQVRMQPPITRHTM